MADGDAEQNELTNRMRACYLRIADNRYLPGGHQGPPNVYVVMAALAEEVREYDRSEVPELRRQLDAVQANLEQTQRERETAAQRANRWRDAALHTQSAARALAHQADFFVTGAQR